MTMQPNRDSALDGMEALHELGYRYIERVEMVDEACDAHTVFVEAWRELPAGTDAHALGIAMVDEINKAIDHLEGDCLEYDIVAEDEEACWVTHGHEWKLPLAKWWS
jgi:hypothetical protein